MWPENYTINCSDTNIIKVALEHILYIKLQGFLLFFDCQQRKLNLLSTDGIAKSLFLSAPLQKLFYSSSSSFTLYANEHWVDPTYTALLFMNAPNL